MRRPTLILAIALFPSALLADPHVAIDQGGKPWSATLVGYAPNGEGLYLTCRHGIDAKKPVHLVMNKSAHGEGRYVAISRETDLALIQGTVGATMRPARIGADAPEVGDKIEMDGHPGAQNVRKTTVVKATGWIDTGDGKHWTMLTEERKDAFPAIVLEGSSKPGFSGGAVLHEGKLCGVVVGANNGTYDAWAVPAESIVWFLRQNEKLFQKPVTP